MDKFKYIFIGVALLAAFLLGRGCQPKGEVIETVIHKTDTIWHDSTIISEPKLVYKHDTEYIGIPFEIPIDSVKLANLYRIRGYTNVYRDSSLEVTVKDSVLGYLMGQKVSRRLLGPKVIHDSITITKQPVIVPKWEFKGGIDATPKNLFLDVEFEKDRWSYNAGYDPFNKQVKVGVKYTLFRK